MLRNVYLHGHLKKEFGSVFRFDIATAGEAFRALNCTFPGRFVEAIRNGHYQIIRGRRHGGMSIDLPLMNTFKLGAADLHVIPVPAGSSSKGGGTIKAVAGLALIGGAVFFSGGTLAAPLGGMGAGIAGSSLTYGNLAMIGLGLTLAGVSAIYAGETGAADDKKDSSFAFSGPGNVNAQGAAVPLIYGEVITGSQPISAGYDIENIGAYK